jgi:hypothetical protein
MSVLGSESLKRASIENSPNSRSEKQDTSKVATSVISKPSQRKALFGLSLISFFKYGLLA